MGNLNDDNKTYIKLYRKVMENAIFLELPYDRWHAFEFLLLKARRFPTVTILKGKPIKLEVGQLICGEEKLAVKWGWSRGKVKRYLDMLENLGMIKKNGTPYGTLITIENYTKYQGEYSQDDISLDTSDSTSGDTSDSTSDGTHKKNVKKDKNVKNVKKDIYISADERHIVPPTLEMVARYCTERNNGVDPQKFIDWYEARGWLVGKTKMKDWQAAVRTWERNDKPKKGTGNPYLDMLGDDYER